MFAYIAILTRSTGTIILSLCYKKGNLVWGEVIASGRAIKKNPRGFVVSALV